MWASPVGLEEEEEPEIKLPTFAGSYRKLGNSKNKKQNTKPSTSVSLIMPKPLTVWIIKKLWKALREMGIPDHLICLLRNPYVGQEATARTLHGTTG